MKRDWINIGRRPSGLCGAAILISSRCHGFKRTTQQIVNVVNVCDETIRRRLDEFSRTESANLSKEEFEKFVTSKNFEEGGMDPPCFKRTLEDNYQSFIEKKAVEIETIMNAPTNTEENIKENRSVTTATQTNLFQNSQLVPLLPGASVYSGSKENMEVKYYLRKTHNRKWEKGEARKHSLLHLQQMKSYPTLTKKRILTLY